MKLKIYIAYKKFMPNAQHYFLNRHGHVLKAKTSGEWGRYLSLEKNYLNPLVGKEVMSSKPKQVGNGVGTFPLRKITSIH